MGALEQIRALYEYNEWANNKLLDAASALSEEQLTREMGASYGSVAGNLRHVVSGQRVWLHFWEGKGGKRLPDPEPGQVLETLRQWYRESHENLRRFVGSLREEEVDGVLVDEEEGRRRELVLWDLLVHVVNHGTQHRAETAMVLTSLGRSPGELDYVIWRYPEDST